MHLISVIVPVYNAEKYIHRCVDSLLSQTYTNFEVILIDDGSIDKSSIICDEYAQKDVRVRVIHKQNGGVSSARQKGLELALGEYIIHADPDDWVSYNWLSLQMETCLKNNADICICGFTEVQQAQNSDQVPSIYDNNEGYLLSILNRTMHASLWNKLIKTSLFKENNIEFIPGLDLREDFSVLYKVMYFASRIVAIEDTLYYYDMSNTNSIVHNLTKRQYQEDRYQLIYDELNFINVYNPNPRISTALYKDMVRTLGFNLLNGDLQLAKDNKIVSYIPYKYIMHITDKTYVLLNLLAKLGMYDVIGQIRKLLNKRLKFRKCQNSVNKKS